MVEQWSFYNIDAQVARQPYKDVPNATLGPRGENLAVVLQQMAARTRQDGKRAVLAALRGAIPDLEDIQVRRDDLEGKVGLTNKEEGLPAPIHPTSISDGTVRLIALLVISTQGDGDDKLVVTEEPENGVHPHLAEHVVEVFRETSTRTQLIITTHSPAFLDHAEPAEVLLCGKVDGCTRMVRASDRDEINRFRKHFALGELWVQGTFDRI